MLGGRDASRPCAIVVAGLAKVYGSVRAVDGVDLEVTEGEVFALLGPNGAGKTTTVEILEGYRRPDAGHVSVLGWEPRSGGRRLRERIGIVLQECAIDQYLTVTEALTQRAGFYPSPRPVGEVIELVGLRGQSRSRVKGLSGGQQRRLDLALALVGDPSLLFLDEPTTGFDPAARRAAWETIRGLRSLGKTILLTTHYMDEAQTLADRVAVIAAGRIVATGPPSTIGGRDVAAATIRFALASGIDPDGIPLTCNRGDSLEFVVQSSQATEDLHLLTQWALERGVELIGLTVSRPSLEDVYLQLVEP